MGAKADALAPTSSYNGSIVISIPDTVLLMVMRKPVLIGAPFYVGCPLLVLPDEGASGYLHTVARGTHIVQRTHDADVAD